MSKAIVVASIICIVMSGAWAQPKVGLGFRIAWKIGSMGTAYFFSDSTVFIKYYDESSWGVAADLMIDFTRLITLRIGALEYDIISKSYAVGTGGSKLGIFSNLNSDLIFVLPVGRRISPLVFAGLSYERFYGKPSNDLRVFGSPYNIRLGLGGRYLVNNKVKLLLDIQLWDKKRYETEVHEYGSFILYYTTVLLGVPRINLGVNYQF